MNAGSIIKLLRTTNRISQDALAHKLGISRQYLSQIENQRREPSLAFLRRVSCELEIPLPFLLVEHDESDSDIMVELRQLLARLIATKVTLWTQPL